MCAGVNRRADPYPGRILRKVEAVITCAPSLFR
ncbi:hypothetical protein J2Z21_007569 [Streptomyces griseochromogenes]|uniref:Transposase n=1 Tax=Streptomyces griseochromogenes TaxID=68214 RepID=A0ABS4M4H1_9ACTN|nr:hypothetical protein [Streptomyces griseochromogenes]